ncbi:MAG: hypothetical protein ACRDKU_10050, partial [Gaiellaceae bacterium]
MTWLIRLAIALVAAGCALVGPYSLRVGTANVPLIGPAVASAACLDTVDYKCYGLVQYYFDGHGGSSYMWVNPFTYTENCYAAMNSSIWVTTNWSYNDYWVEQGIINGSVGSGCPGLGWYWADSRPCCGYDYHASSLGVSLGTTYQVKITLTPGTNNWGLYRDGAYFTSSVNNPCCSRRMDVGLEVDYTTLYVG